MRQFILPAIAVALTAACANPTIANAGDATPDQRTIVVSGVGEKAGAPDMATLTIGAATQGTTAAEALRANSAQVEATIKALKESGVQDKDMQTSGLSVGARYDYSRDNSPPVIIGYEATNSLSVRLRNLDTAGTIIDKAVAVGANRLDSLSFGFADAKPLMDEARRAAVADARAKAELLTAAAGVKLGPVLSISEGSSAAPGPNPVLAGFNAEAKSVPLAAGESLLSATVSIVYAID